MNNSIIQEEIKFNYHDELKRVSGNWIRYLNNEYIELNGIKIHVFKFDKKRTNIDPVYLSSEDKLYLEPFDIRGIHLDNIYRASLGIDVFTEVEDNLEIFVNFDKMVKVIRDLKNKRKTSIFIKPRLDNTIYDFMKEGNTITILKNRQSFETIDLTEFPTTKRLKDELLNIGDFEVQRIGDNSKSMSLVDFKKTRIKNSILEIYSEDITYRNITDVIELGDVILTHDNRFYEVIEARPAGNFGWDYHLYHLTLKRSDVADYSLPGRWKEVALNNRLNLKKIERE